MNAPVTDLQTRLYAAPVRPGSINEEARTAEVIWTTGADVTRRSWQGDYIEALDVTRARLDRLNAGAPLLNSHRSSRLEDMLGAVVPGSARIEGGKGYATIQFSVRPDAEEVWRDVKAGNIRNVSVGYNVTKWEIEERSGSLPRHTAVDWEPRELSLVPIPADAGAQVRSAPALSLSSPTEGSPMNAVTPTTPAEPAVQTRALDDIAGELCDKFGLPASFAVRALKQGKTEEGVRSYILEELARRDNSTGVTNGAAGHAPLHAVTPATEAERIADAVVAEIVPSFREQAERQHGALPRIRTMEDMVRHFAATRGHRITDRTDAQRAMHTLSDFPIFVANTMGRIIARQLPQRPVAIARASHEMPANDYRPGNMVGLTAASPIQEVPEAGEIKHVTVDETGEARPVPRDLAGIFRLSNRLSVNDDLGGFEQTARLMVASAVERQRAMLLQPLLANSGTGQTMSDGQPVFHSSHGNIGTAAAINVTSLSAARLAMRQQKDKQGQLLAVEPSLLIVSPAKETEAQQVLEQIQANQTSNVNPFAGSLELIVEPGLSGNRWYVAADPSGFDGLAHCFLDGMASPRVESREGWESLSLEFRLVWAFDARFVAWTSWFMNPGA